MTLYGIKYPAEIEQIHSAVAVENIFRAKLFGFFNEGDFGRHFGPSIGFASTNGSSFVWTRLSTMIDYGSYGTQKIQRKIKSGCDVDMAIESVSTYWGCGEVEIPHIRSINYFPYAPMKNVSLAVHSNIDQEEFIFYRNNHKIEIFKYGVLSFSIFDKQCKLISADTKIFDLWRELSESNELQNGECYE
jgi:hypothetical protein